MLKALSPVIPHLCHHLWAALGNNEAMIDALWPKVDESALIQEEVQLVVQVNGKLRAKLMALSTPKVGQFRKWRLPKKRWQNSQMAKQF